MFTYHTIQGDPGKEDNNDNTDSWQVNLGIPWTPAEFVLRASQLDHPFETVSADDYDAIQEFIENHDFEAHFKRTARVSKTGRVLETNNPCSDPYCMKEFDRCEEDERAKLLQL